MHKVKVRGLQRVSERIPWGEGLKIIDHIERRREKMDTIKHELTHPARPGEVCRFENCEFFFLPQVNFRSFSFLNAL